MDLRWHTWGCVLHDAHAGNKESMNNILRAKANVRLLAHGQHENAADYIVVAMRIGGIRPSGLPPAASTRSGLVAP